MRYISLLTALLLVVAWPALAQYTGNIPPGTVLGNNQTTARPPAPIPYVAGPDTSGFVSGPMASGVNELASWNNITGNLLKQGSAFITNDMGTSPITIDGSPLTSRHTTAFTANQILDAAFLLASGGGSHNYDSIRAIAYAPANTTINLVTGVSAYVVSDAASGARPGGFPAAVGLFAAGVARGAGAKVWGVNTQLSDSFGGPVATTTTGLSLNNEFDFNISSPNTTILGLQFAGGGVVQPAAAHAVVLQPWSNLGTGPLPKWSTFLTANPGSTNIFASIGAKEVSGTGIHSQAIYMNFWDVTGAFGNLILDASEAGGLQVFSTTPIARAVTITGGSGRFVVEDGGGFVINGRIVMQGTGAAFAIGQDAGYTSQSYSTAAAATLLLGSTITLTPAGSSAVVIGAGRLKLASTTYGALTSGNPCNAGALGSLIWVTDSTSAVFNATTSGGGANGVIVGCDGANWRVR